MKKINFTKDVLPHIIAIGVFLIVTLFFFKPVFFDHKDLQQGDIQQWEGTSKTLKDYREQTGKEGLWADAVFSGMPAYLISVEWGNKVVGYIKKIAGFSLPGVAVNIYLAFLCYYILLLAFSIRPYLAIAGAIAFGLSSYMIVGVVAGHNGRIGAIAFMPLAMAGIHLVFSGKRILGLGVTTAGLALHFRENHIQITYYLVIIAGVYGIVQLIQHIQEKKMAAFIRSAGILILAAIIAVGTFVGPLWGITEYSAYSIRGKSELVNSASPEAKDVSGLSKTYAFEYSNGILEPITLLIPNIYGGSSMNFLVQDQKSKTFKALVNSGDEQMANQLANYTSAYWGNQPLAVPYYAGAIVVFLFAFGIAFAEKKYVWWLVPVSIFAIVISWGSSFPSFNYFLFDYLPAYNKFRSVTFALIITLFSMPLLGFIGLEKLFQTGISKPARKKLLIALGSTGGLCLLVMLTAGMFGFLKEAEGQLPPWLINALVDDRKSLLLGDAFRSLAFILIVFVAIYFDVHTKISPIAFYAFLTIMMIADLAVVDKRYLKDESFKRGRESSYLAITEADQEILKDKSYYRVYNLQDPMAEARTSYFHHSVGGYHGARIRRYRDLYDSCLFRETNELIRDAQRGQLNFSNYGVLNMLNAKYLVYGPQRNNIIYNASANGNAWFVDNVITVKSPAEELKQVCDIDTRKTAVVDGSKFQIQAVTPDSTATVRLIENKPDYLKYESQSQQPGLGVFSEIYYEKGWKAFIDGKPADIIRANYVLRALTIPAGQHTLEFRFEPAAYVIGNTITTASSWLMLIVFLGSIGWSLKKND